LPSRIFFDGDLLDPEDDLPVGHALAGCGPGGRVLVHAEKAFVRFLHKGPGAGGFQDVCQVGRDDRRPALPAVFIFGPNQQFFVISISPIAAFVGVQIGSPFIEADAQAPALCQDGFVNLCDGPA
jgi:hypothetical protein